MATIDIIDADHVGGGAAQGGGQLSKIVSVTSANFIGGGAEGEFDVEDLDQLTWEQDEGEWDTAQYIHSESRPVMLVGNTFQQVDAGTTFGDVPVSVMLTRTGLSVVGRDRFGNWKVDPTVIKQVTGLYPVIKGVPGTIIKISVGAQEVSDDPVTWQGPYDYTVGQGFFQDFTISGRYLAVRFESEGQPVWELSGYDLDINLLGNR